MRKIYITVMIFLFPLSLFATEQVRDILIWKGDTLTLFSNPLELIEDVKSLRMKIIDEIERLAYQNLKDYKSMPSSFTTACRSGYRAEWVLLNDSIFLNNIYHCHNENIKVNLKNIFPNSHENEKIFASWVNADLIVLQGECFRMRQLPYHSVYEVETVLNIENGLLKNIEVFHSRIAKKSDFFEKAIPGGVYRFTHKQINWNNLPDLKNKLIQVNLSVNLNEDGQIESLNEEYTHYIESYLNKSTQSIDSSKFVLVADMNNVFIKESFRIAKLIPEWDVIYQRGKIVRSGLFMEFSEEKRKEYKKRKLHK